MSAITNIYDPASQMETAIATIFALGTLGSTALQASTPATAAQFQKTRPRVEIVMEVGREKQSYHVFTDGTQRNASYGGQLTLTIIAGTVAEMRDYQATVAYYMATMATVLNSRDGNGDAVYLPYHKIQRINGDTFVPSYPFEQGYIASKPIYTVEFGVDRAAWAELGLTAS